MYYRAELAELVALREKSASEAARRENLLQDMSVKVAEVEALKKEAEENVRIEKNIPGTTKNSESCIRNCSIVVTRSDGGVRRCSCHTNRQGVDAAFAW